MIVRVLSLTLAAAIALSPAPADAQQKSASYTFLEAVRDADGTKVTEILNQPGQSIINTKDRSTGEAALHIVAKRGDATYLRFLLGKGANPNIQDGQGNTPAMLATEAGFADGLEILSRAKANLNLGNSRGETPLIRAVQQRNADMVRILLAAGANPDQTDMLAGMSARDYARRDGRSAPILKLMDAANRKPAANVSGPTL